jgi:hypothetical protein
VGTEPPGGIEVGTNDPGSRPPDRSSGTSLGLRILVSSPERKRRVLLLAILGSLAVLPLIVTASRVADGMRGASPASDFALLELSTGEAARGAQLLGPYSRFGWRHPGPIYFYLLAPFYLMSGASSASLPVAVLVINWAALLGIVACLHRWADDVVTSYLALPLAMAYGAYLGPGFLYNIWNPAITVLPLGVLLVLCAGLACGRTAALPIVAATGSFLVQTHVGYLPCAATAMLIAGVFWLRDRRPHDNAALSPRTAMALAAGALAALWALPLLEQLTRVPGNLTLVARFFGRGADGRALGEAMGTVIREIAWPWSYVVFGPRQWYQAYAPFEGWHLAIGALFALGQTALLGFWSARLHDRPFSRALARLCLACTIVAVPAVMRVSGEIRPYLTAWISMVGVMGSLAALSPLLGFLRFPRPTGLHAGTLAFPAGLAIAVASVGRSFISDSQFPAARSVSNAVAAELRQRGTRRPHVKIQTQSPELFFGASAVLVQMHKDGLAFSVERAWWNFFGERWQPTGAEDDVLEFTVGQQPGTRPPLVCTANGASSLCVSFAQRAPRSKPQ